MATYRKRGNKWQARIQRKGLPDLAKSFPLKSDAETWARQLESEIDRGVFVDRSEAERLTLGDVLQRYLDDVTPLKKSADKERQRIDRILRQERLCEFSMSALNSKVLAEWRDRRLKLTSGSSVNRELAILSHAINTARREWGVHIANPIEGIQRPKLNRPRERRLRAEEEARLLCELGTTTRNPWIKPIAEFAIETGMRRGEILSLTWNNVDLQRRVVRLLDTKNGEGRSVPLTLKATALICSLPRSIDGRVFATSEEALKQAFERAVERARIDDLHFHDLRHEAVSRLFEKGLNVMEVASISGSLSEILCVRHNMSARRSMYAKQDEQEKAGSGAAQHPERTH